MLIDAGDVAATDVTLLGVRNLDPPEEEFVAAAGIRRKVADLPEHVYVALDCDVFEPGELDVFMPEPRGERLDDVERLLAGLPRPAGLDLSRFEQLGRDQYRSPGGVVIRAVLREGGGWDVADVEYDGEVKLEQLADGRVRVKIGDLRFEYTGEFLRRVRLSPI